MTEIKICGLTCAEDIACVNKYRPDYAGFVLFCPKSKRNLTIEKAAELKKNLNSSIRSVAVVVSPDTGQVKQIEEAGFDYIQIHGSLPEEVYEAISIPILRAFNVSDMNKLAFYETKEKIKGYVFDSKTPGSGKTFDWNLLAGVYAKTGKSGEADSCPGGSQDGSAGIGQNGGRSGEADSCPGGSQDGSAGIGQNSGRSRKKIFLAGGIDETNVRRAMQEVKPDAIDVSSAVERPAVGGYSGGKNPEKVKNLIHIIRMVQDEK